MCRTFPGRPIECYRRGLCLTLTPTAIGWGFNYETIPVNRPHATKANNAYRDGPMRVDNNGGGRTKYHEYPEADERAKAPPYHIEGFADRIELDEADHFDQPRMFYDMLDMGEKERLIHNIAGSLGRCMQPIQERQLSLFRQVDATFADRFDNAIANTEPPKPEPKPATV